MEEKIYCSHCGALIEDDDYEEVGDEIVCTDCYEHHTTTCDRCGSVIWTDDSYGDEYTNDNNLITYSLDFGSPREVYCDWKNNDTVNIYSRFWKAFIEDQCDVNTRIVSCYVLWKHRIDDDALRKIYYFLNIVQPLYHPG